MAYSISVLAFTILLLVTVASGRISLSPHITIPQGTMVGEVGETRGEREFYKFWCIPYGTAKRFEQARPAGPWNGTLDATECEIRCHPFMGSQLTKITSMAVEYFEECLILNVFTPVRSKKPLPVIFWIHGGYYQIGSSLEYSAELFLDHDVIMVSVNYRLGPLGFLDSGDEHMDGNLGLRDVILGLKWVQSNIKYFGGDPKRVTIFGESAGGGAVATLVLSPLAKGLFHHAISQSGSTLTAWGYQSKPVENFKYYTEAVGCKRETTPEALDCLKGLTIDQLDEPQRVKWFIELNYTFFPSVEDPSIKKGRTSFLPDHPVRLLKEGRFNHVPYIIGVNEDEGAYQASFTLHDLDLSKDINDRWMEIGAIAAGVDHRNISKPLLEKGVMSLRQFYFGNDSVDQSHLQNLMDMFSDAWFIYSMDTFLMHFSKYAPIYPYIFTKVGSMQLGNLFGLIKRPVVSHGDELLYLFYKGMSFSEADHTFSENFIRLWVSFFYGGKPKHAWGNFTQWPYIPRGSDSKNWQMLKLDDTPSVIDYVFEKRMQFWRNIMNNDWSEI